MDLYDKLKILTDGAKYDVACTSSGVKNRPGVTVPMGCCHSFSADGRCISLLKVLMTNYCIYDCQYCVNRKSNDVPRAAFSPDELADLTIQFFRRNYIEGLFLSSGVIVSPDHTMELLIKSLEILRNNYGFGGYIHAKTIPGASPELVTRLGLVADRLSVNIELPSEESLKLLAPNKTKESILSPMNQIRSMITQNKNELVQYKKAPQFAQAGQATQMIIGATPDNDYHIIKLASAFYKKYSMRRVFYSAYIPVAENPLLPVITSKPPLLREHRLYQADWMMRFYKFSAEEILSEQTPDFNPYLDPKCNWAINNIHIYPIDVNIAPEESLLRVPGIGPTSAKRIIAARKNGKLGIDELKRIGVVLKRAQYFITARGYTPGMFINRENVVNALIDPNIFSFGFEQLTLFDPVSGGLNLPKSDDYKLLTDTVRESALCLSSKI